MRLGQFRDRQRGYQSHNAQDDGANIGIIGDGISFVAIS